MTTPMLKNTVIILAMLTAGASFAAKPKAVPPKAAALPAAAQAEVEPTHSGGHRRKVELTPERLQKPIGIRGAPNVATMLSFPEPWAAPPSCGDCIVGGQADGNAKPSTLWRIDVFTETNTIAVKPIAFPGPDLPLTAFEASLDVTLESGIAVSIFLTLAELPANADLRVEFQLPAGADAKSRRTALERELRIEYDGRVAEAVKDALADTMMAGTRCQNFSGGPRQKDGLVVRLRQMCRNGAYLYLVFEVENGSRSDLRLANASLIDKSGAEGDFFRFKKPQLLFRERTLAFAALQSVDPGAPSSTYSLTVVEDGGGDRTVTIDSIDF